MIDPDIIILRLNEKWKVDIPFGWIPINGNENISNTEIYDAGFFELLIADLKKILQSEFNLTFLYEIEEGGLVKTKRISECEFEYNGSEYLYTDINCEIVIYFSHENSVTVGGLEVINAIHQLRPEYKNYLWIDQYGK